MFRDLISQVKPLQRFVLGLILGAVTLLPPLGSLAIDLIGTENNQHLPLPIASPGELSKSFDDGGANHGLNTKCYDLEISTRLALGSAGVFMCIASLSVSFPHRYELPQQQFQGINDLVRERCISFDEMDEAFSPEQLVSLKGGRFARVELEDDRNFGGMASFQWHHSHPSRRTAIVQVDGPYTAWHDQTARYRGVG